MSYEDVYITTSDHYFVDTKTTQYDKVNSQVNSLRYYYINMSSIDDNIYLANVSNTEATKEQLKAVSFYMEQNNLNYEVYYSKGSLQNGETVVNQQGMQKVAAGNVEFPGMQEISTETIEIDANSEYSIIVKFTYPTDLTTMLVPFQPIMENRDGIFPALAQGKSFLSNQHNSGQITWRGLSEGRMFSGRKYKLYVNAYTDIVESSVAVTEVNISPKEIELLVEETTQLTATVLPENAENKTLTWTSANPTIASVSADGEVTGKNEGTTTITATTVDGKKTDSATIKVKQPNYFQTVPWKWEEATQTVSFGKGEITDVTDQTNIAAVIEKDPQLNGKKIKQIIFTEPVTLTESAAYLFADLKELASIQGADKLDTSNVTTMSYMFSNDSNLQTLDVANWNTSKVSDMDSLFQNLGQLTKLDLSNWDTSNLRYKSSTFSGAKQLNTLILGEKSKFASSTGLFENTTYPYSGCWIHTETGTTYQTSKDFLTNFTPAGEYKREVLGTTKQRAFSIGIDELSDPEKQINDQPQAALTGEPESQSVEATEAIEPTETNETANATETSSIEEPINDENLTETTVPETLEATEQKNPFEALTWTFDEPTQTLTFAEGKLANVSKEKNIATLIESDARLNGKKIKKIQFTEKIETEESFSYLFNHLTELTEIEGLEKIETEKVTAMDSLFAQSKAVQRLDLSHWHFAKVTTMKNMFEATEKLETVILPTKTTLLADHQLAQTTELRLQEPQEKQ